MCNDIEMSPKITYFQRCNIIISLPPPNGEVYVFISAGLSVGLSVNNITEKAWTDFHEIFRMHRARLNEQSRQFLGCHVLPLEYWVSFSVLSRKSVSVSNITGNGWTDFHDIFNKVCTWDKEQGGTFSGCCGSPLESRIIFLFLVSVFISDTMEKRMNGFSWNFHSMPDTAQLIITWTVSCLPRMFHGLPSGSHSESVSNIMVKWMSGFSWHFQDKSAMAQGTIWNSLEMIRLNPLIQDLFFYFLDPCVLAVTDGVTDGWILLTFSGYGHE